MKKTTSVLLFFLMLFLSSCSNQTSNKEKEDGKTDFPSIISQEIGENYTSSADLKADRLEVYYFHRTARCYSCKTIGAYVDELMNDKYKEEIDSGLIDFRELNIDLSENKEIAQKFKASGSSLFINRIIDNKDNIEQDTNIWGLLSDEAKFKDYLENKINSYLEL